MSQHNPLASADSPPPHASHTPDLNAWQYSEDFLGDSVDEEDFLDGVNDLFDAFDEEGHFFDSLPRLDSPHLPQDPSPHPRTTLRHLQHHQRQQQQALHRPPYSPLFDSPGVFDSFFSSDPWDHIDEAATTSLNTNEGSVVDLTEPSPSNNNNNTDINTMPPRKRKAGVPGEERASKVTRTGTSRSTRSTPATQLNDEVPDMVDLVDVDNDEKYEDFKARHQAELIKKQQLEEATKPMKLAEFQCIICMDNPTDLTVTHCGHLFCSECLHQALYAAKKCCPVCRTAISTTLQGKDKRQPKNGVFAMEMKLTTVKRGKLRA